MPLQLDGQLAVLTGSIGVEDAEPLAELVAQNPGGAVDLGACTHLHTAALQALASARPRIAVAPAMPSCPLGSSPRSRPEPDRRKSTMRTALLVDDSKTILMSLSHVLTGAGYKVETASMVMRGSTRSPPGASGRT